MKQVVKLIIIDPDDNYLIMWRSAHPTFPNDPDLPGGTVEDGEQTVVAMLREVREEAGITISKDRLKKLYAGTKYSKHGTHYTLYVTQLDHRPGVTISWEHFSFEWLGLEEFLEATRRAKDTYMAMVYDVLKTRQPPTV